ncbi:CoA pyrophosphatase [Rhodovulum sp. DZ06]|uniref:CoA pyrophosphatase n=1 Tax=Rhodovulum sp. DZ06 TaxID=3425126 RepID=UPI003D346AEE
MTRAPLSIDLLARAVAGDAPDPASPVAAPRAQDAGTSDYDLNPDLRPALSGGRPRLRAAAVLCPVVEREGELRVILTRRSDHLKAHSGQVAFPGGKLDPSDPSLAHAALREAEEEIGLPPSMVRLLGEIDGHETGTGFAITPFVGIVDPAFVPRPDPGEVAEVFEPPLSFLMDPANRRRDSRDWQGKRRYFYAIPWEGRYIWGATARMLVGLSDRLQALAEGRVGPGAALPGEGLRPSGDPMGVASAEARVLDRADMPPRRPRGGAPD